MSLYNFVFDLKEDPEVSNLTGGGQGLHGIPGETSGPRDLSTRHITPRICGPSSSGTPSRATSRLSSSSQVRMRIGKIDFWLVWEFQGKGEDRDDRYVFYMYISAVFHSTCNFFEDFLENSPSLFYCWNNDEVKLEKSHIWQFVRHSLA